MSLMQLCIYIVFHIEKEKRNRKSVYIYIYKKLYSKFIVYIMVRGTTKEHIIR
jgi:hypothetical protein